MFSKAFFFRVIKSWDSVVKSLDQTSVSAQSEFVYTLSNPEIFFSEKKSLKKQHSGIHYPLEHLTYKAGKGLVTFMLSVDQNHAAKV